MPSLQRNTGALWLAMNCLSLRSLPPPVARDHQTLSVMGKPHGSAPGLSHMPPSGCGLLTPEAASTSTSPPMPACVPTSSSLLFMRPARAQPRTGEVSVQEGGPPVRPPAAGFLSHSPFWLWMAHKAKATALLFPNVFNLFVRFVHCAGQRQF